MKVNLSGCPPPLMAGGYDAVVTCACVRSVRAGFALVGEPSAAGRSQVGVLT